MLNWHELKFLNCFSFGVFVFFLNLLIPRRVRDLPVDRPPVKSQLVKTLLGGSHSRITWGSRSSHRLKAGRRASASDNAHSSLFLHHRHSKFFSLSLSMVNLGYFKALLSKRFVFTSKSKFSKPCFVSSCGFSYEFFAGKRIRSARRILERQYVANQKS